MKKDAPRQWIRDGLNRQGRKAKELAAAMGVQASRISEIIAGKREVASDEVPALARMTGMSVNEVIERLGGKRAVAASGLDEPVELPPPGKRDLKVRGAVMGGAEGDFTFNGEVADYAPRPPGLVGVNDAFALYVQGDSMSPRFEPGSLVYIHPGRPPAPGNDVVVECLPKDGQGGGPCYLKRLVRRHASRIDLLQFNPPPGAKREFSLDNKFIKAVWRVMTLEELMGVG